MLLVLDSYLIFSSRYSLDWCQMTSSWCNPSSELTSGKVVFVVVVGEILPWLTATWFVWAEPNQQCVGIIESSIICLDCSERCNWLCSAKSKSVHVCETVAITKLKNRIQNSWPPVLLPFCSRRRAELILRVSCWRRWAYASDGKCVWCRWWSVQDVNRSRRGLLRCESMTANPVKICLATRNQQAPPCSFSKAVSHDRKHVRADQSYCWWVHGEDNCWDLILFKHSISSAKSQSLE